MVLCMVVWLFSSHMHAGAKMKSWAVTFHALSFTWLVLRWIFWTLTFSSIDFNSLSLYLLYWIPNPLQFATFLLLPLFYSQVVTKRKTWESQWWIIRAVYVIVTSSLVGFMVAWGIKTAIQERQEYLCISLQHHRCYRFEDTPKRNYFRTISTTLFFALAAIVAGFSVKMSRLEAWQNHRYLIYQPRVLAALNSLLFTVFLSKGCYQLVATMGIWYLPDIPLQKNEDIDALTFCAFVVWDYLPTVLLLLCVHQRGGIRRDSERKIKFSNQPHIPDYGIFRQIKNE
ncbi:unnamed protein product, partial [Chrysoparadoxa australica]